MQSIFKTRNIHTPATPSRVVASDVIKKYKRASSARPATLQEAFSQGFRHSFESHVFRALDGVTFEVGEGSMFGIIGRNGAGKSTLLRLLGGVGAPDSGTITTRGRIGALLDLGAGLNGELTGRENVFVSAVVAGLTRRQTAERFDDIVEFAELQDSIDNPVRTYSSGMKMRLAFAVAVHTEPELLLVDEVLAVGDMGFQKKCFDRIREFLRQGCTIVFVTHDVDKVRNSCDQAMWLSNGKITSVGDPNDVADAYESFMTDNTRRVTVEAAARNLGNVDYTLSGTPLIMEENRFGSLESTIKNVKMNLPINNGVAQTSPGKPLELHFQFSCIPDCPSPVFGITIRRESDDMVCLTSSFDPRESDLASSGAAISYTKGEVVLAIEHLDLVGGKYFVDVGAYEHGWAYGYDYHYRAYPLTVSVGTQTDGVIEAVCDWRVVADK